MNRYPYQLAHVCSGPIDLYVGNHEVCEQWDMGACYTIHVYHESQPGHCKRTTGTSFAWREHDLLTDEQIQIVTDVVAANPRLLIHCAAGLGRSPTLCVLALTLAGVAPWDGLGIVARAMWEQYKIPHCPSYDMKVLNQIFGLWNRRPSA